ncbi:hypothetical protein MTO96_039484, partial [Rhipicephalus appendiculatus]
TSSSAITKHNSIVEDAIGNRQASAKETTNRKTELPRITPPSIPIPGIATSTSTASHQNISITLTLTTRPKPQLETTIPSWFSKSIALYPVVPIDKVRRVIIVTYFRSGSSFVGEILSSTPRTFFHFEPLHMFNINARINASTVPKALDLIGHLFRCEFQRVEHYARWDYEHAFLFLWNHFLWTLCRGQYSVCFNSDAVSQVCSRASAQVMKVTRLHMSLVQDWLRSNPDLVESVKILHLVRDPRGIVASRRRVDWCNESKSCMHQDTVCSELRADLDSYDELKKALPNNTYRLRYEDLSLNPNSEAVRLFDVLGLNYTEYVTRFLKTHTKAPKDYALTPHSTRRDSSIVPFQWKTKLSYEDVVNIQRSCSDVLLRLGYKTITSEKEMLKEVPLVPVATSTEPVRRKGFLSESQDQ